MPKADKLSRDLELTAHSLRVARLVQKVYEIVEDEDDEQVRVAYLATTCLMLLKTLTSVDPKMSQKFKIFERALLDFLKAS